MTNEEKKLFRQIVAFLNNCASIQFSKDSLEDIVIFMPILWISILSKGLKEIGTGGVDVRIVEVLRAIDKKHLRLF